MRFLDIIPVQILPTVPSFGVKTKADVMNFFMLHWGAFDFQTLGGQSSQPLNTIKQGLGRGKVGMKTRLQFILDNHVEVKGETGMEVLVWKD